MNSMIYDTSGHLSYSDERDYAPPAENCPECFLPFACDDKGNVCRECLSQIAVDDPERFATISQASAYRKLKIA